MISLLSGPTWKECPWIIHLDNSDRKPWEKNKNIMGHGMISLSENCFCFLIRKYLNPLLLSTKQSIPFDFSLLMTYEDVLSKGPMHFLSFRMFTGLSNGTRVDSNRPSLSMTGKWFDAQLSDN
jgi:hypothetical protein